MGDRDSGIILGLIIGAIIAIALLNRKTVIPTSQKYPVIDQTEFLKPVNIPRVDDVIQTQAYDTRLNQIESQLEKTALHLEKTTSKLLELNNTISKIQSTQIPIQQPIQQIPIQQPIQPIYIPIYQPPQVIVQPLMQDKIEGTTIENPQLRIDPNTSENLKDIKIQDLNTSIYKNNEKWDIKRGSDGRIKSLNIIRDVKKQQSINGNNENKE